MKHAGTAHPNPELDAPRARRAWRAARSRKAKGVGREGGGQSLMAGVVVMLSYKGKVEPYVPQKPQSHILDSDLTDQFI